MRRDRGPTLLVILLAIFTSAASSSSTIPVIVLVPLREGSKVVRQPDPTGATFPVFRAAPDSPLIARIRKVLAEEPAQASLRLDRYARNARVAEETSTGRKPGAGLTMPMFLLVSQEEGGFARNSFWLEGPGGKRELVAADYVDLVVRESDVEEGSFEEIFCHELAHLILRITFGTNLEGMSPKMHQSMTITDYATAFDEGYAESFQPLARDLSSNPLVRKTASGTTVADIDALWLSRVDRELRTNGVKQNLFIYEKALAPSALEDGPDRYRIFLDGETSTAFSPGELKNGQQMMSSEGVVATLFYRFAGDARLRGAWRSAAFYAPFLGKIPSNPSKDLTALDNVQIKLLAAIRRSAKERSTRPVMTRVVEAYSKLFPDEAKTIVNLFLSTTRGATATQSLALLFREAATEGRRGNVATFRRSSEEAFGLLDKTVEKVLAGALSLDANLGPEMWLRHDAFLIARAPWQEKRDIPLLFNLNTATIPELMTVPGVTLPIARQIVSARSRLVFFTAVFDLATEGVLPQVVLTIASFPPLASHLVGNPDLKSP
jgi:hypothetical protein